MSLLHAVKRLFSRSDTKTEPVPVPVPEPEPRTKERAKVVAAWYESELFRLAINRGKIDGVQVGNLYHCTHPRIKHIVRADDGRVLKTFYVGDFYASVIAAHEDWAECKLHGDDPRYRPNGWRDEMDATLMYNG